MPDGKSQVFSLALHLLLGVLLVLAARSVRPARVIPPEHVTPVLVLPALNLATAHGGGSNQTAVPAKHGLPPPKALRTFIPPQASVHPALAMPITISFDIPIESASSDIGDPLSKLGTGGLGITGANAIGDHGCCGGIGDAGSGAPGLASAHRERGVTPPQLVYKVEPEFSEEARKAKHQGVVVLTIEVDAGGNVRHIRVRQSLGLGLDEKAIDAVSRWRFRPGALNGKPVATEAVVQVSFQLL